MPHALKRAEIVVPVVGPSRGAFAIHRGEGARPPRALYSSRVHTLPLSPLVQLRDGFFP